MLCFDGCARLFVFFLVASIYILKCDVITGNYFLFKKQFFGLSKIK